jgi:hypothetical protein
VERTIAVLGLPRRDAIEDIENQGGDLVRDIRQDVVHLWELNSQLGISELKLPPACVVKGARAARHAASTAIKFSK